MKKVYGYVAVLFLYMFTASWAAAQTNQNSCYYTCSGDVNQAPGQLSGSLTCQQAADYCADYAINKALPGVLTKYSFEIYPLSQTSGRLTCAYNLTYTNSQGTQSHAQYSGAGLNGQCTTPPTCTPPAELINGQCVTPTPVCPPPSVLSGNQCVCPAPNALVNGVCLVPPKTCPPPPPPANAECPVLPLTALPCKEDDPDTYAFEYENRRLDISRLQPATRRALDCLATNSGMGYQSFVTSAWRPPAYQGHFQEIYAKWKEIKNNTSAACITIKDDIRAHLFGHSMNNLETPPAPSNGPHPAGRAFDVNTTFISTVDRLSTTCGVYRPLPGPDKWHVQAR